MQGKETLTSTVGGRDPGHHGIGQVEQAVHVAKRGTSRGQTRRAKEALQETQDHEAGEVVNKGSRDRDDDKEEHGDNVDWVTTDARNLAEGRKDERTNTVAENVEGETESRLEQGDVEFLYDALCGRGVNGRSGVDDKSVKTDDEGNGHALHVGPVVRVRVVIGEIPVDEDGTVLCALWCDGD